MSQMNALPDDAIWLATYDTSDGDYGRDNESLYYLPESSSFAVEYYYHDTRGTDKGIKSVSLERAFDLYQRASSREPEYLTSKDVSKDPRAIYILNILQREINEAKDKAMAKSTPVGSIAKMDETYAHLINLTYLPQTGEFIKSEYRARYNDPEAWEQSASPIAEGAVSIGEAMSLIEDADFKLDSDPYVAKRGAYIISSLREATATDDRKIFIGDLDNDKYVPDTIPDLFSIRWDLYYAPSSGAFTVNEVGYYCEVDGDDWYKTTKEDVPISKEEALRFINSNNFYFTDEDTIPAKIILGNFKREMEGARVETPPKPPSREVAPAKAGEQDRDSVFAIVPAKIGRASESVRYFDVPDRNGGIKPLAEVTLPHGTKVGGMDASFYRFVVSANQIDAGGRDGSRSHSVLLPERNRTTGEPWRITLTRDFGGRDANGAWQPDKRTITTTSTELRDCLKEQYQAYRERAQQRQAERQPHQDRGDRASHDGLDLDAEGRDAREISSGFAHGRDRQPDFAGRDL